MRRYKSVCAAIIRAEMNDHISTFDLSWQTPLGIEVAPIHNYHNYGLTISIGGKTYLQRASDTQRESEGNPTDYSVKPLTVRVNDTWIKLS